MNTLLRCLGAYLTQTESRSCARTVFCHHECGRDCRRHAPDQHRNSTVCRMRRLHVQPVAGRRRATAVPHRSAQVVPLDRRRHRHSDVGRSTATYCVCALRSRRVRRTKCSTMQSRATDEFGYEVIEDVVTVHWTSCYRRGRCDTISVSRSPRASAGWRARQLSWRWGNRWRALACGVPRRRVPPGWVRALESGQRSPAFGRG